MADRIQSGEHVGIITNSYTILSIVLVFTFLGGLLRCVWTNLSTVLQHLKRFPLINISTFLQGSRCGNLTSCLSICLYFRKSLEIRESTIILLLLFSSTLALYGTFFFLTKGY